MSGGLEVEIEIQSHYNFENILRLWCRQDRFPKIWEKMYDLRLTIWAALACYTIAMGLILHRLRFTPFGDGPRFFWTLGWAFYVIHVAIAFHQIHGWSHARAVQHTDAQSGFGEGIFLAYFFTFIWTADVLSRWFAPAWHAGRPRWLRVSLHAFIAFILFNGAVVFADGASRALGVVLTVLIALAWLTRPGLPPPPGSPTP